VRHPIRWLLGGFAVVLIAVIGFGAWYVFGSSAPAKPKLDTSAPVQSGGPVTPDGAWTVVRGDNVYLGYRMTEVFAGDIVHKTAVGRTPTVDGTATITGTSVTAADVKGDLRDLSSDRASRDNYIHSHGIESDTFPFTEFKLTSPIALPAPLTKGTSVKVNAIGQLTLHNVTKTITVPLDARWNGDTIDVVGTAPIVLADYNITPPDTGVVKVDDHGSLELSLTFRKS
jgi:polyisoprenoid-binding protein YceI